MLQGKKILLGITGSIAAYKSAHLVRLLVKAGADVKVIMTTSAAEFITPLTLATLSKHPVLTSFTKESGGEWNNHVELGLWADVFLIAPASANTLAKMASGQCDNLLLATYLSARCTVLAAPAMDLDMYAHPSTRRNFHSLTGDGVKIIDSEYGELASGLIGQGRMAEPEEIISYLEKHFSTESSNSPLAGKKILITAGPTYEPIDPVRFIGNHSSGKMGYALAEEAAHMGAEVFLVSGPTACVAHHKNIKITPVQSAAEMNETCQKLYPDMDIAILAAAVADYTPETKAEQKIKKKDSTFDLKLKKTTDIAEGLGKLKKAGQVNIGFALETENEIGHAQEKLVKKNFDLIVLNSLNDTGAGFGHDTNKISIIDKQNNVTHYELKNKTEVARDIINAVTKII